MRTLATLITVFISCSIGVARLGWTEEPSSERVERTAEARTDLEEQDRAVKVWNRYAQCLKDRRFQPCFSLLSRNVLETWRRLYDVTTSAQYADVKGSEEVSYTALTISHIKRQGNQIVVSARTRGDGEGGKFAGQMEVLLVKEEGNWRIDRIVEEGTKYLP